MSYEASVMEQAMETARKRVLESYDEDGWPIFFWFLIKF